MKAYYLRHFHENAFLNHIEKIRNLKTFQCLKKKKMAERVKIAIDILKGKKLEYEAKFVCRSFNTIRKDINC